VTAAENAGYPRASCSWVKGIYSTVLSEDIERVIVVVRGDCRQMEAMVETLNHADVEFIPFSYPFDRSTGALGRELEALAETLGTDLDAASEVQRRLEPLRAKVARLDELTWMERTVTGWENHLYQVSCSDFWGDLAAFEEAVEGVLADAAHRESIEARARIGFVGVPPIYSDLYDYLDELGIHVVFNETQRQFTMSPSLGLDLLTQYQRYTYPYDIFARVEDIRAETAKRDSEGIIHYVQSFCYRQIYDHMLREAIDCPVLTLEGDRPGILTGRDKLRLEAFCETLEARRMGAASRRSSSSSASDS
jgi:benzoyl-CoA reductase/2-hydroxyglutaryl-CoA dehydratase subunit BcrC/BadD/HgdB